MRRLPQQLSLLALSVFTVGVIAVAPVSARELESGGDKKTTTNTTTTSTSSSGSSSSSSTVKVEDSAKHRSGDDSTSMTTRHTEVENETEHPNGDDSVTASSTHLQERGKKLVDDKRAERAAKTEDKKTKTVEQRQQACVARQANLTKKVTNYTMNAKKHLEKFNSVYDKVLAYKTENQLSPTGFDTLKANADAKKTAATAAVSVLSAENVTIDCAAQDPAQEVATLKASVSNARTALQDYRKAIKDLVVALQQTKKSTTPDGATGSN